jgi:cytochrome c556
MRTTTTLALACTIALGGSLAFAAAHGGNPAVKARQAHMQLYSHNLGILGGMAKGEIEYSADAAQAAADNLVALSGLNEASYWVAGTSRDDLGEETRALPGVFAPGEVEEHMAEVHEAAMAVAAVASNGQDALGPVLGPLGQACGSCHEEYRAPAN